MTPHRDQFPNCLDFIFHKRCVNFRGSAINRRDWLGATLLNRTPNWFDARHELCWANKRWKSGITNYSLETETSWKNWIIANTWIVSRAIPDPFSSTIIPSRNIFMRMCLVCIKKCNHSGGDSSTVTEESNVSVQKHSSRFSAVKTGTETFNSFEAKFYWNTSAGDGVLGVLGGEVGRLGVILGH